MSRTSGTRTLVIGSGLSGIAALKASLERDADENVVLYERSDNVGGIWNYTGKHSEDQVTCAKTTTTNTSKEFFAFGDYRFSDKTPNFVRNCVIREYIEGYRDHFNLNEKIIYNRKVVNVKPTNDDTNRYDVVSKDIKSGKEYCEKFDFIYVCNGKYAKQKNVVFPNQDQFKGRILHSRSYMDPKEFTDQEVCIVGIGNTAVDIAVDLSKICKKVHISTRSGNYILNRCGNKGLPLDLIPFNRYFQIISTMIPSSFLEKKREKMCNTFFDHELYGLKPKEIFSKNFVSINDDLPNRIITGEVVIHRNIKNFTEKGIVFENGDEIEVDTVILATGFELNIDFLDESIVKIVKNNLPLYRNMILPDRTNIAFIGYITPRWTIPPVVEMQSRYIARVFKGNIVLPSEKEMRLDIDKSERLRIKMFQDSTKFTLQCKGYPYLEKLAADIGCKPNFWRIIFKDPRLFVPYYFQTLSACQYRLVGPNSWAPARKAILDMQRRIECPFGRERARRRAEEYRRKLDNKLYVCAAVIFLFIAFIAKLLLF